jgi:hypothetical protein
MVNTIRKEVILIMCSYLKENARYSGHFPLTLRITKEYTLQTLCGTPHNVCNEEGKLNGMEMNRRLADDIICGPFFVVGDDGEGDFTPLTDRQIADYKERFAQPEQFADYEPNAQPFMRFTTF